MRVLVYKVRNATGFLRVLLHLCVAETILLKLFFEKKEEEEEEEEG